MAGPNTKTRPYELTEWLTAADSPVEKHRVKSNRFEWNDNTNEIKFCNNKKICLTIISW